MAVDDTTVCYVRCVKLHKGMGKGDNKFNIKIFSFWVATKNQDGAHAAAFLPHHAGFSNIRYFTDDYTYIYIYI